MTERAGHPGIRGYDFDDDSAMPRVSADYDLFGMSQEADMLLLDRISETAHLGGAALFPERQYIVRAGDSAASDPTDDFEQLQAERTALMNKGGQSSVRSGNA